MLRQVLVTVTLLAVVAMTGCAEFTGEKDHIDSNPAIVAKFDGKWKVEKQIFQKDKAVTTQTGTAVGEMVGKTARIWSSDLKLEVLFGIRQDGEYALVDANAARDHILIGRDSDEEEEDGDEVEVNNDLNLKFGRDLLGEIKFIGNDVIEISYFKEHHDKEIPVEKIILTRLQ